MTVAVLQGYGEGPEGWPAVKAALEVPRPCHLPPARCAHP